MARARGPTVGDPAPPLRLPCAQGGEIDLQSYRGRALVIVWFTKGFSCPFCRQQMSQLARVAPKYRAVGAEVLVVSENTVESHLTHGYEKLAVSSRAQFLARLFQEVYWPLRSPE